MLKVPGWELGLRGEVVGRDSLAALRTAWDDLSARAADDNAYYTPRYATSLLASVERDANVRFAAVWEGSRLIGLLPFTKAAVPIPILRPAGQAWRSKYTFSCMPLLDKARGGVAADALLDVLASAGGGEWVLPTVNIDGEASRAMIAALQRRGSPWVFANRFERAALETGPSFEEHMERHVSSKRRRDLARNRRRLEQMGAVGYHVARSGSDLKAAVAAFLKIEASGWKGKRGTALACDETTAHFAETAFTGDESTSICRADLLTLNGAPIAVSLLVMAGTTGFTVKACYDEEYRSYCAGLLLEIEVIRSFLSEKWAHRLDSATAGSHVIDSLWPGRISVGDLIFSLATHGPQLRLSGLQRSLKLRTDFRSWAKKSLHGYRSALESRIRVGESKRA